MVHLFSRGNCREERAIRAEAMQEVYVDATCTWTGFAADKCQD
jgi:hypothetical protein